MNDLHYAVVVGINRYPGISDLSGARADADQFAAWLTDPEGGALPDENVKRVSVSEDDEARYDSADAARPTGDEVDTALKHVRNGLLQKLEVDPTLWEESRIYLYFAGHGFAPQGGEGALFLANAERDLLSRNLELAEYRRWCTTCAFFREVIVFADCCRTRIRNYVRGFGPRLDECPAPWNGKSSTYVIGFGSTLGNPTYELPVAADDNDARGYFTGALLEGLRGAAPRDEWGAITASTLSSFVKTVVAERTRGRPFPQEAQIVGPLTHEVRFGTTLAPPPPPKRVVTVVLPATLVGGAVSILKDGRPIAVWDGANQEWEVELEDGLYEVQAEGAALENDGLFKVGGEDRRVELQS
jgi:uncharacterized caspase-like protein